MMCLRFLLLKPNAHENPPKKKKTTSRTKPDLTSDDKPDLDLDNPDDDTDTADAMIAIDDDNSPSNPGGSRGHPV